MRLTYERTCHPVVNWRGRWWWSVRYVDEGGRHPLVACGYARSRVTAWITSRRAQWWHERVRRSDVKVARA